MRLALCAGLMAVAISVTGMAAEVPVPQNYGQAMSWYERAANGGNPEAQFYLGVMYESGVRGNDISVAAKWYRMAAEQGHVEAQARLGVLYYRGEGVERDPAKAAQWYAMAADGGSAQAQYNLALMYDRGRGVPANLPMAAALYAKASDNGIATARLNLSMLYAAGAGVERDPFNALMWLTMAEASGLTVNEGIRQSLAEELGDDQAAKAKQSAIVRLKKSAGEVR